VPRTSRLAVGGPAGETTDFVVPTIYSRHLERMLLQLAVYTEMPAPPTGRALLLGARPLQCAEAGCTSPSAHKSVLRASEGRNTP